MRVLLATKDQNLRISLQLLVSEEPGLRVVGTASETDGLRALIKTTRPDLVIVDWDLPGKKVGELLVEARRESLPGKFIVLGKDAEDKTAALESGTHGFVLKAAPPEYLVKAIRSSLGIYKNQIKLNDGSNPNKE